MAPLPGTTRVSRYQKGKTNLDFTEARDSEWHRHQLGHMQVCTSLQSEKPHQHFTTQFFTGRMPFLPPNQQRQSTEGTIHLANTAECVVAVYSSQLYRTLLYIHSDLAVNKLE